MADVFSRQKRSRLMALIKGKNTKPELLVRRLVFKNGFRFKIHDKSLPGTPDIVLPRHKKIIFVHGCFWHGHGRCTRAGRPSTNTAFWNKKLDQNIGRDKRLRRKLQRDGWQILTVWQCETQQLDMLLAKLERFLGAERRK